MKNFTKAALIVVVVLVILGSALCAVGMGIGFTFSDFWDQVYAGEFSIGPIKGIPFIRYRNDDVGWDDGSLDWDSAEDAKFTFPWEDIKKIEMDVDYTGVRIVESTDKNSKNADLKVEYRQKDHTGQIKAYMSGSTLKIEDSEGWRKRNNDSARITLELPVELMDRSWLEEISLEQERGYINVEMPLTAKEISISVGAGECDISEILTAEKELSVEVGAGRLFLEELEAEKVEINGGVGNLTTGLIQAEKIEIEGGVGKIEVEAAGKETDYSYNIKCGVGRVEIGENDYSGLGTIKSIDNPGNKKMEISCSVGTVDVSFENE